MGFLLVVNLWNINSIKTSSFIYSIIILIQLLIISNLLHKTNIQSITLVIKGIIAVYFINVFITTLFIFKQISPPGILSSIFQIYKDPTGQIRPYGFSNEPSYASILMVFVSFIFFKINKFIIRREDYKWYLLSLLTILLIKSSYGYLFLGILLIYVSNKTGLFKKHILKLMAVVLFIIVSVACFNLKKINNIKAVSRLIKLSDVIFNTKGDLTHRVDAIRYIDGSAAMRLFPTVMLIHYYQTCTASKIIFGNGAGQSTKFYTRLFEGRKTNLGFFPAFVFNYGILGTLLALLFFVGLFPKQKILHFFLFFLFCFNADFNTQIFQFILFTAMISKFIDYHSQKLIASSV